MNSWRAQNQQYLAMALAQVRHSLAQRVARRAQDAANDMTGAATPTLESGAQCGATRKNRRHKQPDAADADSMAQATMSDLAASTAELYALATAMEAPPALEALCMTFGLSAFERSIILLCAGAELDAAIAALCATAQGDAQRAYPTFGLALATFPEAHWSALAPVASLRRCRLIEIGVGHTLSQSPLRLDERVTHYLCGLNYLDERLGGMLEWEPLPDEIVPSQQALIQQIVAVWMQTKNQPQLPIIQLCGPETVTKLTIASAACAEVGLDLKVMAATALPHNLADLEALLRLWEREAALHDGALLLDCDEVDTTDVGRMNAITWFSERIKGVVLLSNQERRRARQRPVVTFEVSKPSTQEQRVLWQQALGPAVNQLNGQIEMLTSHFDVGVATIRAASAEALGAVAHLAQPERPAKTSAKAGMRKGGNAGHSTNQDYALGGVGWGDSELGRALWNACRTQARPRLDDLAQRIDAGAHWEDLVLPAAQFLILREIAAHVRQRTKVYETWGFAAKGGRGLGISALFAGVSGTGKTMAAEVLARELGLDLYRIDLSSVVSKYIGETEKNLGRVFNAAEAGGAILLFDEADALFGKRSEVKDSHDRYANIEVGYLLQRMESYRGLAILTTNLKNSVDPAFLRRIRFVTQFPFPDAAQRAEIWRRVFPSNTPTEGLDADKLAQLIVAGGNIRNMALNAAFLAADVDEPVRMTHLLGAAQSEYAKLEKTLTNAEVAGWI